MFQVVCLKIILPLYDKVLQYWVEHLFAVKADSEASCLHKTEADSDSKMGQEGFVDCKQLKVCTICLFIQFAIGFE